MRASTTVAAPAPQSFSKASVKHPQMRPTVSRSCLRQRYRLSMAYVRLKRWARWCVPRPCAASQRTTSHVCSWDSRISWKPRNAPPKAGMAPCCWRSSPARAVLSWTATTSTGNVSSGLTFACQSPPRRYLLRLIFQIWGSTVFCDCL